MHLSNSFIGLGPSASVSSIMPLNEGAVRVFFTRQMSASALFNATGSYSVTPDGGSIPLSVIATSAEAITYPTYIDLSFNTEMTNGSSNYTLDIVSGTTDYQGNNLSPLSYDFSGYGTPPYLDDVYVPNSLLGSTNDNITFKILDAGSQVDSGSINISISQGTGSAQSAFVSGSFIAPFNGPSSSISPFETGYSIVIDPSGSLTYEVTLFVTAQDTSYNLLSASFSSCEDTLLTPRKIIEVPEMETLLLHWNFESVTGSGNSSDGLPTTSDAKFIVEDISSGSLTLTNRYEWLGPLRYHQYPGVGDFFLPYDIDAINVEYIPSAKQLPPEVLNSANMVEIRDSDDTTFTRDTRPIKYVYSIEKSPYAIVTDEILKIFATIKDFNNLIGEPVNRYRQEYKSLEKLRNLYFERIGNSTIDFEKFVDYYKWFDSSISLMLQQLIPASANFSDEIRTVVESHVLERNKHWTKFPTLEMKHVPPEGGMKGINELLYDWQSGSAPVSGLQSEHSFWWKNRAERTIPANSSGNPSVDLDRTRILDVHLNTLNRSFTTSVRFNVAQQESLSGLIEDPIKVQNIKNSRSLFYTSASVRDVHIPLGNYDKDYQIIQTSGRSSNNRYLTKTQGTQSLPLQSPLSGGVQFELPDRSAYISEHVFVERFSSPGEEKTMSRGYLDRTAEEYSVYNNLNFRNSFVRNRLNLDESTHAGQFGVHSTASSFANYHKVNRNTLRRIEEISENNFATASNFDNAFLQRAIPQSELQYQWITSSANIETSPLGYTNDFYIPSGMTSIKPTGIEFVSASSVTANGINVDFVGLNNLIYDPLSTTTNTLSASDGEYRNTELGTIDSHQVLNSLLVHRDGSYQYPTWKQVRVGEHPIVRAHKKENTISVMDPVKSRDFLTPSGNRVVYRDRRSDTFTNYNEPAIVTRYKPIIHTLNVKGSPNPVQLRHTFANNISMYTNPQINNQLGLTKCDDQLYDRLKEMYLDSDQTDLENPINGLMAINYREVVYPKEVNTGKSVIRGRINYAESAPVEYLSGTTEDFQGSWDGFSVADYSSNGVDRGPLERRTFWRNNAKDRIRHLLPASENSGTYATTINNSQGFKDGRSNSVWPFGAELYHSTSYSSFDSSTFIPYYYLNNDFGELNQFHDSRFGDNPFAPLSGFFGFGNSSSANYEPLRYWYSYPTASAMYYYPFCGYDGPVDLGSFDSVLAHELGLRYKTPSLSGKNPWYDNYNEYFSDIKQHSQDYSILPEFNITKNIEYYVEQQGGNFRKENDKYLSNQGAFITQSSDSEHSGFDENFFKIYSHSDFMKYFDGVIEDHQNIDLAVRNISLTCKGIKKLLPYNGFYPITRTLQLANLFSQSVAPYIGGIAWKDGKQSGSLVALPSGALAVQSMLQPFFAPGILYNTIKSGIAVDWPVITGSAYEDSLSDMSNTSYGNLVVPPNYRLSFETLVDLKNGNGGGGIPLSSSNGESAIYFLHPGASSSANSVSYHSSRFPYFDWNGNKSPLYEMSMHNFLAETIDFFLKNSTLKTFSSLPESKILGSFRSGSSYFMDVSLYKTKDISMMESYFNEDNKRNRSWSLVSYSASYNGVYFGPEYKMTDFVIGAAPPLAIVDRFNQFIHNADPSFAPNTPPYFYGKSTARIRYDSDGTENQLGTISKIVSKIRSNVSYDNRELFNRFMEFDNTTSSVETRAAWQGRMNLSSSINLFDITRVKKIEYDIGGSLLKGDKFLAQKAIDSDNTSFDTWTIGSKFECPILNFKGANSGTNNYFAYEINGPGGGTRRTYRLGNGMWSGYGDFCTGSTGIFLSLEESFPNLSEEQKQLTGSLIQALGFKTSPQKLGEIADSKEISEAVVAIPFVDTPSSANGFASTVRVMGRNFFAIDKDNFNRQKSRKERGEPAIPRGAEAGDVEIIDTSISTLSQQMTKYVIPPEMNFIKYDDIPPFIMYIFEFKHILDKRDLADIWQGVMPKIAMTAEKDEVTISHGVNRWEFFEGKKLPPKVRWMVFKIKKQAKVNYFEKTADSRDDDRFKFDFKVGTKAPDYSSNYPYDFFSLVELAQLEAEISIAPLLQVETIPLHLEGKLPEQVLFTSNRTVAPVQLTSFAPTLTGVNQQERAQSLELAQIGSAVAGKSNKNAVTAKPIIRATVFGTKK